MSGIKSLAVWKRRRERERDGERRKTDVTASSGMEDRKGGDEQEEEGKKWMLASRRLK